MSSLTCGRRLTAGSLLVLVVMAAAVTAQTRDDRARLEREAAERRLVIPLVRVVDAVMAGEHPAAADATTAFVWTGKDGQTTSIAPVADAPPVTWSNHFLKSDKRRTYVPFTIGLGPKALSTSSVALYVRVVAQPGTTVTSESVALAGEPGRERPGAAAAAPAPRRYAFEDYYLGELRTASQPATPAAPGVAGAPGAPPPPGVPGPPSAGAQPPAQPPPAAPPTPATATAVPGASVPALPGGASPELRLTRAFAVPAGEYDVYVAIRPRASLGSLGEAPTVKDDKNGPTGTMPVLLRRYRLTVPDFWNTELTTSSILLADRLEALTTPPAAEAMRDRPYVIGAAELVPSFDTVLRKTEQLTVFFQIYNPMLGDDRSPDVSVDYVFERREGGEAKVFNKIPTQTFNGRTLPANFDVSAGHQLSAGWSVPMASFPVGDYRLAITVTDKRSGQSIARDVLFTVAGT